MEESGSSHIQSTDGASSCIAIKNEEIRNRWLTSHGRRVPSKYLDRAFRQLLHTQERTRGQQLLTEIYKSRALLEHSAVVRKRCPYSISCRDSLVRTCLFTSASEIRVFNMLSSSSMWLMSQGRASWSDSNFQIAVIIVNKFTDKENHPPSMAK
jgi:hypothetical protein